MDNALIKEEKYQGQYVAIKDFDNPEILTADKDPKKVYESAVQKGFPEAIIVFIPETNLVQIYFRLTK